MQWNVRDPGVLALPSGRLVLGRPWSSTPETVPDRGLYAMWRDPAPTWPYTWIRWPDFGLPLSRERAWTAIEESWRAAEVERVEVACGGGRGRTGTVLAAMAVMDGLDPDAAVAWVRQHYDRRAVEMPWQHRWLQRR